MENQFSLREISEWNKEDSEVKIPELQRGLVWSPKQTEFLWDSLLRGFPIGGFVLSENQDKSYYLMDGQQRWNTISLGFRKPSKDSDSFLWLDINPEQKNTTRKYFAKVITKAHPWGFNNDEDCSFLSANETKAAMENMWGECRNIFNEEISIDSAFPHKAKFPIPMYIFLTANTENKEEFFKGIQKGVVKLSEQWKKNFWTETNQNFLKKNIEKFFNVFSMLSEYKVSVNILSDQTIQNEDEEIETVTEDTDSIHQTNLEILFTRLNTMGTRISQDDLYYSAIKAYWGGIKKKIEDIANGKIAPAKLTTTLFRLILTINDKKSTEFHNQLTITKIRNLTNDEKKKNNIEKFINQKAETLVNKLEDKLKEIPKYLKVKIISETEEIYLLLLYLMYIEVDIDYEALALLLYFFAKREKGKKTRQNLFYCINKIFESIPKNVPNRNVVYKHALQRVFSQLIAENKIWNIEHPNSFIKERIDEYIREYDWQNIPSWFYFWEYVSTEKDFLIYAQNEFLTSEFKNYNPADLKSCEGHNRPWDYDHIIPNSWSKNKRGAYKGIVDYWLWKNGNFAAIPYSENRSKSDNSNWSYYNRYSNRLLFDSNFENIKEDLIINKNMASSFSTLVFERSKKIYSKIFNKVECFICGNFTSDEIGRRKTFFNDLCDNIRWGYMALGWNCYFEANDWDYEIENDNHWSYPKVTFGVPFNRDNYMVAVTWEIGNTNLTLGIRGRKNGGSLKRIFSDFINNSEGFSVGDEYYWFVKKELEIQNQLSDSVFDILCPIIKYLQEKDKW